MQVRHDLAPLFTSVPDVPLAAAENYNSPFAAATNGTEQPLDESEKPAPGSLASSAMIFNSGMMLLQPSMDTYERLLEALPLLPSYNGGDQGFLNIFFQEQWMILPPELNVNKMTIKYGGSTQSDGAALSAILPSVPSESNDVSPYVMHFVRRKPWMDLKFQACTNFFVS